MKLQFTTFFVIQFLLAGPTFASDSAGQAGSFLRIGLGPRAKGLGDAYVAVADNAFAAYYNPAGLAFLKNKEVSFSYSLMSFDRTFSYIGFSRPLPPSAGFSFGVLQSGFKDSDTRLSNGETFGEHIEDTQYTAFLGFALRFGNKFAFGITPKLIYSKVYDVSASSIGVDLGAMYRATDQLTFGMAVKEIGQSLKYTRDPNGDGDRTTTDDLPRITKIGAVYRLPLTGTIREMMLVSDYEMNSEQSAKMHFGIEAGILEKVSIRIGLDAKDFTTGLSIPFKMKDQQFRFDYAFIHDARSGQGFGTQDFALSYVF
ncbi:PorV/PorQ family protein [bacterium]|nr:PorV/PorQ family protein [bacterium]